MSHTELIVRVNCPPADGLGFSQMQHASPLGKSIIGGIHALQYFRSKHREGPAPFSLVSHSTLSLSLSLSLSPRHPGHPQHTSRHREAPIRLDILLSSLDPFKWGPRSPQYSSPLGCLALEPIEKSLFNSPSVQFFRSIARGYTGIFDHTGHSCSNCVIWM